MRVLMEPRVEPVKESVEPALRLKVTLEYTELTEIPLSGDGVLLAEDDKVLAAVTSNLVTLESNRRLELGVNQQQRDRATATVSFTTVLSSKALDHIDDARGRNPRGDVALHLQLKMRSLRSRAVLSSVREMSIRLSEMAADPNVKREIGDTYRNAVPVCSQYDPTYKPDRSTMWIVSGDGGPVFLALQEEEVRMAVTIPSSSWLTDFAPHLGLGRYLVVEIPKAEPPQTAGQDELATRVNEAIHALEKVEKSIAEGEWNEVMEDVRPVYELLRHRTLVRELLRQDGYTEEAADSLLASIQDLFNCSSKFHHKVDQTGRRILPEIKASREDAYLVYLTTAGLVNLLTRKIRRYRSS